jgi:hypothetical protein
MLAAPSALPSGFIVLCWAAGLADGFVGFFSCIGLLVFSELSELKMVFDEFIIWVPCVIGGASVIFCSVFSNSEVETVLRGLR